MARVLRTVDSPIFLNGVPYTAQVVGRPSGHMWEGWVEFAAADGSDARRTPRETTQPNLEALVYWASGLSPTYLEGALARTTERLKLVRQPMPAPLFDEPEPSPLVVDAPVEVNRAVLDPFSVGAKGEDLLRKELGAMRPWHLRNIIRTYDLADPDLNLETLSAVDLVELIVQAVHPA